MYLSLSEDLNGTRWSQEMSERHRMAQASRIGSVTSTQPSGLIGVAGHFILALAYFSEARATWRFTICSIVQLEKDDYPEVEGSTNKKMEYKS
jgi:hypothetical protein